jgi:hypothetical protein
LNIGPATCVGVCNKILEATPTASTAWEAMTNEQFARIPKPSVATVDAVRAAIQNQMGAFCESGR